MSIAEKSTDGLFTVLKWTQKEVCDLKGCFTDLNNRVTNLEQKISWNRRDNEGQETPLLRKRQQLQEDRLTSIECSMSKIGQNVRATIANNHKIARNNTIIINAMVEKLEKNQKGLLVVDLDANRGGSRSAGEGISTRTQANIKRKTHTAQILKQGLQDMKDVEKEAVELLNTLE